MVRISDAELEIMEIVWVKGIATTSEIAKEVTNDWNQSTIRTLIGRLHKKGALEIVCKDGKALKFVPTIKREEYRFYVAQNLIKKLFNNSIKEFLLCFCNAGKLTVEELEEILNEVQKRKNK